MTIFSTLISLAITLVLVGFFAGMEIAFISANRLSIELKKKQGRSGGIILSHFMEHPARYLWFAV